MVYTTDRGLFICACDHKSAVVFMSFQLSILLQQPHHVFLALTSSATMAPLESIAISSPNLKPLLTSIFIAITICSHGPMNSSTP